LEDDAGRGWARGCYRPLELALGIARPAHLPCIERWLAPAAELAAAICLVAAASLAWRSRSRPNRI
jgi:hypothetical protein